MSPRESTRVVVTSESNTPDLRQIGGQARPKMLTIPIDAHVLGMSIFGRGLITLGGEGGHLR
jgi:hypothetical protein